MSTAFKTVAAAAASIFLMSLPAHATSKTAEDWGEQAQYLVVAVDTLFAQAQAAPAVAAPEPAAWLVLALQKFGMMSSQLSSEMAQKTTAHDFVCIFRGMVDETGLQLDALKDAQTGAEAIVPLERLSAMLHDASAVSAAAAKILAQSERSQGSTPKPTAPLGSCDAQPWN